MSVDVPKNTFKIKPLKNIEESKSEVSSSEEDVKEINILLQQFL